jgi:signal transduction histidine kinase
MHVRTSQVGRIKDLDEGARRFLNAPEAAGRFLISFVDPVSYRGYLDALYQAVRTGPRVVTDLFLRPLGGLPVRCRVAVDGVAFGLTWSFQPLRGKRSSVAPAMATALAGGEREARRIARDLHDDAGQLLAVLHLAIDDICRDLPEPARTRVGEMRELVRTVEAQLRQITHEIRPPGLEDLGLAPALEALAAGVENRTATRVTVRSTLRARLSPAAETHLYRIAQEALANAVRHGAARHVTIRIDQRAGLAVLTVRDDGLGFDVGAVRAAPARGLGLIGIQERVETLRGSTCFQSAPGKGTTIMATVPIRA